MRHLLLCLLILVFSALVSEAQTIECSRTSLLENGIYNLTGTAHWERFDNGAMRLRLGEDFETDSGPDVQIYLSNDSTSIAGGVMIADIGTVDGISHFNGAISFDIPGGTDINGFEFIVFRCVSFNAFWGGGRWAEGDCGGSVIPPDTTNMSSACLESLTATTNWIDNITICPNDGNPDVVPLLNNLGVMAGDEYAFIIADVNNNIREVILSDRYDFEGSSLETEYVFGVSYRGDLIYTIGEPITSINADSCAMLSSTSIFLTVQKMDCSTSFDCIETITATTNWGTLVDICPGDGISDIVPFLNNQFQDPGDHYAYLLTDENNVLLQVLFETSYDFEDSGSETNRIFGISYAGDLNYSIGHHIADIAADSCFMLSDSSLFLTITKNACNTTETFSIRGRVVTRSDEPIVDLKVKLSNGDIAFTDEQGRYNFENLPPGDYMVSPFYDKEAINGISSTDLILVTRHILQLAPFDDPFRIIAADANKNGSVSANDLVQLKRVLLGQTSTFSNNTSWRFFFGDSALGIDDMLIEETMITIIDQNRENVDFVGVKIGDVNGSASLMLTRE